MPLRAIELDTISVSYVKSMDLMDKCLWGYGVEVFRFNRLNRIKYFRLVLMDIHKDGMIHVSDNRGMYNQEMLNAINHIVDHLDIEVYATRAGNLRYLNRETGIRKGWNPSTYLRDPHKIIR